MVAAVIAAARDDRTSEPATDLVAALLRSSEVPLEIAEQAAEVAVLARIAATEPGSQRCAQTPRAAAALAASATAVAVTIVNGNLAAPQLGESQRDAARIREAAHVASERAGVGP